MGAKTYKTRGIVLRKTKLGEKDLVVTLLDESGALVRAVAKGARKPGGSYAAKLELFSCIDLMLARGRNLDVITSAMFAGESPKSAFGIENSACASALAELLTLLSQEDLPNEHLFPMSQAAFGLLATSTPAASLTLACSAMLKSFAYSGFRPRFTSCAICGNEAGGDIRATNVPFSFLEGGFVCANCQQPADAVLIDLNTLRWAEALMRARFEDVATFETPTTVAFAVLHLIRQWTRTHAGRNLKSIDFLLSSGLF